MLLIVITPDNSVPNETNIVNRLFENGLQRLHLRKPGFTVEEYRSYLKAIDSTYHNRVVLHGNFELTQEFEVRGIHLNSMLRNDESVWKRIEDLGITNLSTSFHSWDEIRDDHYPYKYVFISPVFDSISKKGYKAAIELSEIKLLKNNELSSVNSIPLIVGLGGVDVAGIKVLHEHGFDGAAMLGAIWYSNDPVGWFVEAKMLTSSFSIH